VIHAVDALRKVRASRLRERPARNLDTFEIGVFVVLIVLVVTAWWKLPITHYRARGQERLSMPALFALLVPALFVGTVAVFYYRRWRKRGTVPFAFPLELALPRWRILERDGAAAVVLTDTEGVLYLIVRPDAGEPLDQVLDACDPDNELVVDEAASTETELRFELEEARPAHGILRRCDDRSYLLLLVPPARLDDLAGVLAKARTRSAGEPVQKWRPLSADDVIVASRRPRA